jgi:hypothetical protein
VSVFHAHSGALPITGTAKRQLNSTRLSVTTLRVRIADIGIKFCTLYNDAVEVSGRRWCAEQRSRFSSFFSSQLVKLVRDPVNEHHGATH